jgi:hypothetical protein
MFVWAPTGSFHGCILGCRLNSGLKVSQYFSMLFADSPPTPKVTVKPTGHPCKEPDFPALHQTKFLKIVRF